MIEITLNAEKREFPEGLTVSGLIESLDLGRQRVAVLRNGEVIRREEHASSVLADGDTVEIVHMVGGG